MREYRRNRIRSVSIGPAASRCVAAGIRGGVDACACPDTACSHLCIQYRTDEGRAGAIIRSDSVALREVDRITTQVGIRRTVGEYRRDTVSAYPAEGLAAGGRVTTVVHGREGVRL